MPTAGADSRPFGKLTLLHSNSVLHVAQSTLRLRRREVAVLDWGLHAWVSA